MRDAEREMRRWIEKRDRYDGGERKEWRGGFACEKFYERDQEEVPDKTRPQGR